MKGWIVGAAVTLSAPAGAQDSCRLQPNGVDACERARALQADVAPSLPTKISANMTMVSIVADKRLVAVQAVWHFKQAEIDDRIVISGQTGLSIRQRMQILTANAVCSHPQLSAFVFIGGQVRYSYRTDDGFIFAEPTVEKCPPLPSREPQMMLRGPMGQPSPDPFAAK